MDTNELSHIIEAILFVAGEPVFLPEMQRALECSAEELNAALYHLESDYSFHLRGICLKRFGDHVQLSTRPDYAPYVERLLQPVQRQSLSQSAMETLSIIAYKQPVTKLEIESIRGVKCDYSVQSLVNKNLIGEVGRKDTVGHPILYGTTDFFLSHFGLRSLEDLPRPPENEPEENIEPLVP